MANQLQRSSKIMFEPIQVFVPTFRVEEVLNEMRICLEKGWTGLGFKTIEFEEEWCAYTGLPHAHFLSSATAGLHLAVRIFKDVNGWQDGDEIITTPLTFVSTNHVIRYENLTPVFADVDNHLCLSPDSIRERITPRTRAVMFVGLGGNTGQLEKVAAICREHNLRLIMDGAHMSGTRLNGRHVGPQADVTIFSFQAVKNLPTADSGMICFNEKELDTAARKWSWLGISKDTYARTYSEGAYKWMYDVEYEGFKYHGNSIMAAMGIVSLRYLDQDNSYRRQLASWYDAHFHGCHNIDTIPVVKGCESSRHLYQVIVPDRDQVMLALNAQKIYPGVHYRDNTHYKMYAEAHGSCPYAHQVSKSVMPLPMHMHLSNADVDRVASTLISIVNKVR
jgi:dTDP-4-amino-4,6-dideoxygalactose transaminase